MRQSILVWILAGVLCLAGCSKPSETAAAGPEPVQKSLAQKLRDAVSSEIEIPAGTELQVRLAQSVGSAQSTSGQKFDATLHTPIVLGDKLVIPKGATVHGRVTQAVPSGRLKTPARLSLTLDSLEWQGRAYPIQTTSVTRAAKSHKKRNAVLIGGGTGAGALIGGLAGGGKGALIGAGAGAAAGTAGAYATGKYDILLPPETHLTFKLEEPVKVKK